MHRLAARLALALLVALFAVNARAAAEVVMTGDARIHGTYWSKTYFTGWNGAATRTTDPFTVWQRFRLRTDFIANEALKFRLGIRVNNTAWGNGTYTVDNPAVSIDVYQAYLQFYWPGSDVEFSIGQQDVNLPVSGDLFSANPVLGGIRAPMAAVTVPLLDGRLGVTAAYLRFLDSNRDMDPTTTQVPDELDAWMLALPATLPGFTATPWGMLALAGKNAGYAAVGTGGAGANQTLASNLFSAGQALPPAGQREAQTPYFWAGAAFALTALDPVKFYADAVWGEGGAADRGKNRRRGYFVDAAVEYAGFDALTPRLAFWIGSGENGSTRDGSERMPVITSAWGPGNSLLFDCTQEFSRGFLGVDYLGSWGLVATLDDVSFIQDLSSRLSVSFAKGLNSGRALRAGVALWGYGNYFQMGRELAETESVVAVNLDSRYNVYKNLALILETGWAHGAFDSSVWGPRLVNQAKGGDVWKASLGLRYKF
ncbi:hypothetical protein NNJEOMEG_03762 [Fundidesulfovibrio magnetotacticus]|uniref:Outer membrane homotrimeric porin n=1 Tax=Fundidesulfovibrio magnetotacticus TaxID=2730080 RepID=A0A6V8M0X7_9BACT|nr:outer membrane homotrimeric porin [Fundidesulfovibrio magnetotacticus]GFK95889.1 hypothetical protein NNJEOMEG_03762 [Fundidesulfovibrio magnetotacticus]